MRRSGPAAEKIVPLDQRHFDAAFGQYRRRGDTRESAAGHEGGLRRFNALALPRLRQH